MTIYQPRVLSERTIKNFAPTRLAIKELAGELYFCKSTKTNIEKYTGSGVRWTKRIKEYGRENIKTLWVSDWYHDPYEIQEIALHFSKENQIVESDRWANLIPENGLGGGAKRGRILSEAIKLSIAESLRIYESTLTEEEKSQRSLQAKERYAALSVLDKNLQQQKRLKTNSNKPIEEKNKIIEKRNQTHYNKDKQEREKIKKLRIENGFLPTDEDALREIRKKALDTRANKTPEEKDRIKSKRLSTISNKTAEEKEEMYKKMSNPGASNPRARSVSTPLGIFYTIMDAAASHKISKNTLRSRCNSTSLKWKDWSFC